MILSLSCWGPWHLEMFQRFGAPSLRANLRPYDALVIHTRAINRAAICKAVPEAVVVADVDHMLDRALHSPERAMTVAWESDLQIAKRLEKCIGLLWPDVIWSAGIFDHYRALLARGSAVIFQHCPRIIADTAAADLETATTNRDLARIAIDHEHPLAQALHHDSGNYPEHSEAIHWRVPGGIMTRIMGQHPVIVDPARIVLNDRMMVESGEGVHEPGWVGDSDDAIALSLVPADRKCSPGLGWPDRAKLKEWQEHYPSPPSAPLSRASFRLHDRDVDDEIWRDVDDQADALIDGVFGAVPERVAA